MPFAKSHAACAKMLISQLDSRLNGFTDTMLSTFYVHKCLRCDFDVNLSAQHCKNSSRIASDCLHVVKYSRVLTECTLRRDFAIKSGNDCSLIVVT